MGEIKDRNNTVHMCCNCAWIVPKRTLACPSCGGILFQRIGVTKPDKEVPNG